MFSNVLLKIISQISLENIYAGECERKSLVLYIQPAPLL